jgi:hypothetical protein
MSDVNTPRRHYLLQRIESIQFGEEALGAVWRYKQEAQPGNPLPLDFPFLGELAGAGYTCVEDLNGADARELLRAVNLSAKDALTVLAALAKIVSPTTAQPAPPAVFTSDTPMPAIPFVTSD